MFDLNRSLEVLSRTPVVLQALLGGLSDFWTRSNYGEKTFSPFDVVGHLIEAEQSNWMTRANILLKHGESQPFPVFDRYAMFERNKNASLDRLLAEFAQLRAKNLADLQTMQLTPAQFALRGTHPDLGPVTLEQLLSAWVVHDLGHLHQIAKAMSYQYRDAVGPWREFLTILPRE